MGRTSPGSPWKERTPAHLLPSPAASGAAAIATPRPSPIRGEGKEWRGEVAEGDGPERSTDVSCRLGSAISRRGRGGAERQGERRGTERRRSRGRDGRRLTGATAGGGCGRQTAGTGGQSVARTSAAGWDQQSAGGEEVERRGRERGGVLRDAGVEDAMAGGRWRMRATNGGRGTPRDALVPAAPFLSLSSRRMERLAVGSGPQL